MVRRGIKLLVFAFFWCVLVSAVWAQEFRFTCTSDMQGYDYTPVLNQMLDIVGDEGVFHISPGDVLPVVNNFNKLQSAFGDDVIWVPVMGNHDEGDKDWIVNHNQSLPFDINWGPRDSCDRRTTFSFDYGNAHFVILDEYCVNSGDIDDALYDWLVADLTATAQPAIFVFGHEPAYPLGRHLGDSLDQYPGNRDRFWQLLHDRGVVAYFNGHTHQPSVYQEPGYDPWQVDTGQARGLDWGDGFVDVTVRDGEVEFNYYRGPAPFYLWWHEIVEIQPWTPPGPLDNLKVTFTPVADTFVNSSAPTSNYGTSSALELDGSPTRIIYLRFNLSGLGGAVQSARLRFEVTNRSSSGGTVYRVPENSWGETTLTFDNRPVIDGLALDTVGQVEVGDIVEFDVTSAVNGNGIYSFAVVSDSSNKAEYRAREDSIYPPQLIVSVEPPPNTPPQIDSGPTATPSQLLSDQTAQLSVLASDPDGDSLTYTWSVEPGTISGTGATVTYTPPAVAQVQTFTVTVAVTDGQGGSDTATVDVIVEPVAGGGGSEVTFTPAADSFVNSSAPTSNFGTSSALELDGSPTRIIYLRFDLSGLGGAVQSARLQFEVTNRSSSGGTVYRVPENSWGETTLTFDNRPVIDGLALDTLAQVEVGDIVEFDVTSAVNGNGIYSFAVVSDSSNKADYRAREDSIYPPQLIVSVEPRPPHIDSGPTATPSQIFSNETAELSVLASDPDGDSLTYTWSVEQGTISGTGATVTYTPPAVAQVQTFTVTVTVTDDQGGSDTATVDVIVEPVAGGGGSEVTFTPVADTFVDSSAPTSNFGTSSALELDGSPTRIIYLRFNLSGLGGAVQSARLRFEVTNRSSSGGTVYRVPENSWGETTLTFDNRPVIDGLALDTVGQVEVGDIVEFDVTSAVNGNGIYSFAIVSDSSNKAEYRAREDSIYPPQLIVSVEPPPNTPPQIDSGPTATPSQLLSDQTAQLSVLASDPDGDSLTYTWSVEPGTISGTGATVTYTPPAVAQVQTFTVTVAVTDGQGGSDTATVDVIVEPVAGGGGSEVTFMPVADTFVNSSAPTSNFGTSSALELDGSPTRITYLRFDLSGLSGAVQSARLRFEVTNRSSSGGTVYRVPENSWGETTLTFNNRPVIDGLALDTVGQVEVGDIVEFDVTSAVNGNGIYSFAVVSDSSNKAEYRAREDSIYPPTLTVVSN